MSYISAQLTKDRSHVLLWKRINGKRILDRIPTPLYFYLEHPQGTYDSIYGKKLMRCDFDDYQEFYQTKQDLIERKETLYESDIRPEYKILSGLYGAESVMPHVTLYDIETDYNPTAGFAGPSNPYAPINAISMYHMHTQKAIVYAVPPKNKHWNDSEIEELKKLCNIVICKNEKELLTYFMEEIEDTDILSGWNSMGYDDPYIYERLKIVFNLTVANKLSFVEGKAPFYKEIMNKFRVPTNKLITSGRILLDYMELFIKFSQASRDSWSLDAVAEEELEIRKIEFDGSLYKLYNEDFIKFLLYSIRDTEILRGLEDKFGFMALAVQMSHANTCLIEDALGTTKQTEMAIINEAHENKLIVPDASELSLREGKFKGAYVVPTIPGLYEMVGTIDVTSLYPSTMRTLNLSPETIMGQFYENNFAFEEIVNETNNDLTLLYENEMSETMTAKQWKKYLKDAGWIITAAGTVITQEKMGIIPSILTRWFTDRKKYKKLMAQEIEKLASLIKGTDEYKEVDSKIKFYDRLQNIKKLSLNSLYGACGNAYFKFYDVRIAESTTRSGEQILRHMLKTVGKKMGHGYVYPNPFIVAGDTDSAMFLTEATNLDDALTVGRIIQKAINISMPIFLKNTFLTQDDNSTYVSVEFENIGKRAIFVGKKNYLINLIYKDGNIVDTFKIMGVQIKKTNLPKYIRKDLTEFMKTFLHGKPWSELGTDIVEYREKIKTDDNILILGLPKQIKGLEEYTKSYKDKPAVVPLTSLKLPGHVAASILWNELLEENEDKVSIPIRSGMKIKIFYMKERINGFKSIAVPEELKIIPDWFKSKIYDTIDRELQIIRLVDKPLQQILSAINEELATRQSLLIEDEFEF